MTVAQFDKFEDFLKELREESLCISDKIVRWQCLRTYEGDPDICEEHRSYQVDLWVTALRRGGDEPYLMEFGKMLGIDDHTGQLGSRNAEAIRKSLIEICDDCDLKLRDGKIEVF